MSANSITRSAAVTNLFDRVSAVYDTPALQTVVYRPPQDEILRELRRTGARRIADVGCGTGILASRIASEMQPEAIYGFDLSAGMLDHARNRSGAVTWVSRSSDDLGLADGSLDAVVSSHAFHFFDQPKALAEFRRVLAPGGILAFVIVTPVTPLGSRLVSMSMARAGQFPDVLRLRRLCRQAGFTSVHQRRVSRGGVTLLSPDVLTVAY